MFRDRVVKMRRSKLNRNHYFFIGLVLGLVSSIYFPHDIWELVQEECSREVAEGNLIRKFGLDFEPHLNLINKPLSAKKAVKNFIRPRYYSSELGIREKIFIGVMTSQDNINSVATAINRTTAHLVNKIKFFINAVDVKIKTYYKLKNIVGFTDTRESLRPFHVIKYIADNYLDDYDYFLIIPDSVYVDARKLCRMLNHLSITFDIYMGYNKEEERNPVENLDNKLPSDRNYCDLNAGILLSASVVRKMRNNLDWCVRNGVTNMHSVNIGRCVRYSSQLNSCQKSFQGVGQRTYELKPPVSGQLYKNLNLLARKPSFQDAITVYPVSNADDFYRIHSVYSKLHLQSTLKGSSELEQKSYRIANGSISNDILEIRWPLGASTGNTPDTRHDILTWQLINGSHIFLPNPLKAMKSLSRVDKQDFNKVLQVAIQYTTNSYPYLTFEQLHSAYRKFDPTRGMDFHLHLKFTDKKSTTINKSFHVVKPLGRVEIIPTPYVTESTRITILLPTFEQRTDDALDFIGQYERTCMRNQDNTFLLMIFLYRTNTFSKGIGDPFKNIKTLALDLSSKYKSDGSRIAWVSIRLPASLSNVNETFEDIMINSIYVKKEILRIAVADLALPKIGLDSLVLMTSTSAFFRSDFLNRVRMNTIQGFQIYSPIPFMNYPCEWSHFCKECESCDVSQATGYFDIWNYDIISFYSRDYVQARKLVESNLPIIRGDSEIDELLKREDTSINNIVEMFLASKLAINVLRAVEPNLRFGLAIKNYLKTRKDIPPCPVAMRNIDANHFKQIPLKSSECIHLAARKQIGDAIVRFEDRSILHKS